MRVKRRKLSRQIRAAVFAGTILFCVGSQARESEVARIAAQLPAAAFDRPVLAIGESHRHPRSHMLTEHLIWRALDDGRCVTFALELPTDQTDRWRHVVDSPDTLKKIEISPIHDSPSLRALLVSTSKWAQSRCLKIEAIDVGDDRQVLPTTGRDGYMAKNIAELVDDDRLVIALLGSNHAPRRIDWDYDEPGQSTVFYLRKRGIDAYVVLQDWVERPAPIVLSGDAPTTVAAFNRLQAHRSTFPAKEFTPYADMLIQWPDTERAGEPTAQ